MEKLTSQQIEQLREKLPDEAVTQHPTKTFLSSIKAIYVVERLNKVFGIGQWHLKSEIIDNKSSMIVVKSILTIPSYGIELESYGGNNNGGENSKNFDLGDAYKGATTDALTKICSYLEIGMDVFKGKHQHKYSGQVNSNKSDDLPWLNPSDSDKWNGAIKFLQTDGGSLQQIEKKYRISKENKSLLVEKASAI